MLKRAGATFERFDYAPGNQDGAEGRVTAGNSLPRKNNVRLGAPVFNSKGFSRAAHSRHNFVGDEKNAVFAADFRDASGVTFWRHSSTESCTDNRLKDECCGRVGVSGAEKVVQIVSASKMTLRKSFLERAVIAKTRRDMAPFWEQRLIRGAPSDISAERHRAERAAVITLAARDHAKARGLAFFEMVLANKLDRGFGAFRSPRSKIDATAVTKIARGELKKASSECLRGRGMKLRGMRESNLRRLLGHCTANFGDAVADPRDSSLAGSVQETRA